MTASFALLRVRIKPQGLDDTPLDWLALDSSGQILARGSSLPATLPEAEQLELILPASRVAAHLLEIPEAASRHEAALIRQALEDRMLQEAAQSVIVSGKRHGKHQEVWTCARDWLECIVTGFSAAGRLPERITPEQALLAPGSCAETASGWIFQKEAGVFGLLPSIELLHSLCGSELEVVPELLAAADQPRANLFAGLPSLRRASAGFSLPMLKPAIYLLLTAAVIYLLAQMLTWSQLASREKHLRQAIRQNFAAANPGVPIVDPILQWRQRQSKPGQQGGDALDQLGQLASLVSLPLQPNRIEAEEGRIKLTLTSDDASRLKQALQSKAIRFDSQTTDSGLEQISLDIGASQQ